MASPTCCTSLGAHVPHNLGCGFFTDSERKMAARSAPLRFCSLAICCDPFFDDVGGANRLFYAGVACHRDALMIVRLCRYRRCSGAERASGSCPPAPPASAMAFSNRDAAKCWRRVTGRIANHGGEAPLRSVSRQPVLQVSLVRAPRPRLAPVTQAQVWAQWVLVQ